MILEQYSLVCLSQNSYLIADETSKRAVIIDPRRDVDLYLEEAERLDLRIAWVVLTHFHADFLAGHLELQKKVPGLKIACGQHAKPDYEHRALSDGVKIELGPELRLEVLETPGHTPEGICLVVVEANGPPTAVFTGDTLFLGDVGRPDLMASVGMTRDELARSLFHSLRDKIIPLPDATIVYPGHGAGSMCGKALSSAPYGKLGEEKQSNPALRLVTEDDEEGFVRLVCADQPDPPAYFAYDADLNRRERQTLDEALQRSVVPWSFGRFLEMREAGAQVLDVRDPEAFEKSHLAGSINVGFDGSFATWAGTVLDREREILIIAEPGKEREAVLRLGRIGLDHVAGYLEGGPSALSAHPELLRSIGRVTAAELARERAAGEVDALVVDVRTPGEHQAAAIEGAVHIPLRRLQERLDELPRDRPIVLHCKSGYRSSVASSLLENAGFENFRDLVGGFDAWLLETGGEAPACSA